MWRMYYHSKGHAVTTRITRG
ncbi:hypothetical protein Goshw_000602, partial [Gossypium schwendimanii]|nr:hypothetical protein [Gossypium schwendimanii]